MKTKVSTKGQVVLPAPLREQDDIQPGQEFDVERLEEGVYRLTRRAPPKNQGLVDWLLSAPEKGWFESLPSESTDTL